MQRYPKQLRLLKRHQFLRMRRHSKQFQTPFARFEWKANRLSHTRLGITATRKVGKAYRRNHLKRLVREAYRLTYCDLPQGFDLVISFHPAMTTLPTLHECVQALMSWEKQINRTKNNSPISQKTVY